MFDFNGSKSIYDKAQITRVIFEGSSLTVEFQEGYEENETFVPVGTDHETFTGETGIAIIKAMSAAEGIEAKTAVAEQYVAAARAPEPEPEVVEE